MDKFKAVIEKVKAAFNNLDKSKKIAMGIGVIAILLAIVFGIKYIESNKYGVLYSGLDTTDAASVTKALEDEGIDMKIEGNIIYVPKEQVDKLRIELSSSITNGSKGFELMDEGSNFSMTDEEFQIKKLRMLQGELEKTIKTFSQVDDARVHITQGDESVFTKESTQGKAAVYVSLKIGEELDQSQIKSIMSLVSASTTNIPKQNIEVIDQNMNLLSEGIYDEAGNSINGIGLATSRSSEKEVSEELQKSILSMLEAIFGKNKVKVTVNASLNFDTIEKSEIKVDPETVIKSESRSENTSGNGTSSGSPVDNNMSNTEDTSNNNSNSKEEIEYEVGKTEIKTITTSGEVKGITAAIAIDGTISDDVIYNIEKMVSSALGINTERGDQLSVISMEFNNSTEDIFEDEGTKSIISTKDFIKYGIVIGIAVLLISIIGVILVSKNKKSKSIEEEESNDLIAKLVKEKEAKLEKEISQKETELSLEDEIRLIVSNNTKETTELIKTWLND